MDEKAIWSVKLGGTQNELCVLKNSPSVSWRCLSKPKIMTKGQPEAHKKGKTILWQCLATECTYTRYKRVLKMGKFFGFSHLIPPQFSNRTGTSVDDGARKSNDWIDQWQRDKLDTGSQVQSISRAFPSSNDVAKSAYYVSQVSGSVRSLKPDFLVNMLKGLVYLQVSSEEVPQGELRSQVLVNSAHCIHGSPPLPINGDFCNAGNKRYYEGESWIDEDDKCISCTCKVT